MDRDTRTALLLCAAFLVLWIVWAQLSPGTYDDDDVTHFFMARESLAAPELLISLWGRPLFTLLYSLPAQMGYAAVEITTALVMSVTLFLAGRLARRLELRPVWLALVFTAFQPIVFKLGFSSLVEPLGALTLSAALLALLARRDRTAALLAGLLPLTRFELVVLAPFVLLPVWRRRPGVTFLLAALPMLIWNAGGWLVHGDPIWLANQILNNEFGRSFAGARPLGHYVRALPFVVGGALLVPFALGLVAPWRGVTTGRNAVRGMVVTFLAVLSFLAWDAHEIGGSVGYLRHLVSVGPLIGLVATMGVMRWQAAPAPWLRGWIALGAAVVLAGAACALRWYHGVFEHPVNRSVEPWMAAGAAIAAALVLLAARARRWLPVALASVVAIVTLVSEPPIPLDAERAAVREAVEFVEVNAPGRTIAVNHPWFFFLTGHDRSDTELFPRVTQANLERLEPGSFVVWENHYSARLAGDVPLEHFARHPDRYLPRAKGQRDRTSLEGTVTSQFTWIVFEVVRPDDPRLGAMR